MRKPFYTAYGELFDKGFFGLTSESYVEDLPLIDRINLYYKVGPFVGVDFTEEEAILVSMVEDAKTWDDVVVAAHKIYAYGKQEASRLKEQEYGKGSDEDESEQQELDDLDGLAESEETGDADAEEGAPPEGENTAGTAASDPESLTDKAFRAHEQNLVDPSSRAYAYANLPSLDLKGRIVPFKTVYENMNFYGEESDEQERVQNLLLSLFKKKNEKYIGYLVKEFELRKNARQFARAAVSTSGKLDMKKIHNYKTSEDLFRKMTIVPQGKNHGLLMFLDLSGSMTDNMRPTLEQTLILATFCRKVNIPFTVYGFSDSDFIPEVKHLPSFVDQKRIAGDLNALQSKNFRLREYLTSSMTTKQFIDAQKKLLYLAECHGDGANSANSVKHGFKKPYLPASEMLNGTPLDETIIAAMQISRNFKQDLKLDVVNIIFLTDGDGCQSEYYITEDQTRRSLRSQNPRNWEYSLVVTDPKTKLQGVSQIGEPSSAALLRLFKAMTGFNVIGFFLMSHRATKTIRSYVSSCGTSYEISEDKAVQDYRKNGYFAMIAKGYDAFYMLPGGNDLEIGDETLKVAEKATKTEIKKAFKENLTQKSVNRVFLTRFADMIA
jgi:hypothetical protein